jgi:metal-responsive CopG/Arc/MetJ family transcriptional regulator
MAKARVSVTVDRVLLRRCDRVARGASRSQVFEQALERWLRDLCQRSLEEEVECHYSSLSGDERAEDSEWAGLASRSSAKLGREPEPASRVPLLGGHSR